MVSPHTRGAAAAWVASFFCQSLVVQKGFMRIDSMICVFDYRNLFSFTFGQGGGLDDDDGRAVVDNTHLYV